MAPELPRIYLVRHGETEWSASGRHTGRSDIALTELGRENAQQLGKRLHGIAWAHVLASPRQRALQTGQLAGFGNRLEIVADLAEVDYGEYEGLRTQDIRRQRPGWNFFRDGCPGGETLSAVAARADRVADHLRSLSPGNILLFSHRHFLQILAARWIGLAPALGRSFTLSTASLSVLSYYRDISNPVIEHWNDLCHLAP